MCVDQYLRPTIPSSILTIIFQYPYDTLPVSVPREAFYFFVLVSRTKMIQTCSMFKFRIIRRHIHWSLPECVWQQGTPDSNVSTSGPQDKQQTINLTLFLRSGHTCCMPVPYIRQYADSESVIPNCENASMPSLRGVT